MKTTYILSIALMLGSLLFHTAWAQCPGSAPGVQLRWDFNSNTAQCNGATARPLNALAPVFQGNVYNYCPNLNSGCGQATLGSRGHRNDEGFGNGLILNNFYNAAAVQAQGGAAYDPASTTFNVESAANLVVTYTIPAGKSGCLSSFALNILQKQFAGTVNFARQGVAVKRNGVLIYNQTQPISASQVNGTPMSFSLAGGDFCYDGASAVTFEIIFGLVQQLTPPGLSGGPATTAYDDITLNGTCSDSSMPVVEVTPATCGTAGPNADARITLRNTSSSDRFDLSVGAAYTGSANFGTATPIQVGGLISGTLASPASPTLYTVRVFTVGGCTTDLTLTLDPTICPMASCVAPVATAIALPASCSGNSVLNNAAISLTGVSGGDRVAYSPGGSYTGPTYARAQSFSGATTGFSNLPNPNEGPQLYVVRVFNGGDLCFRDFVVTMPVRTCVCQRVTIQIKRAGQPDPNSTPNNNIVAEDDLVSYEVCPSNEFIDLKLAQTVSPTSGSTCPANTNFVWRIVLSNAGWMQASNIQVSNVLPVGMQLVSATATAGTYGMASGWQVPTLNAGASATLLVTTRATQPGIYTSCAWVSNAFPLNDPNSSPLNGPSANEDDNACSQITVVGQPSPEVTLAFSPVGTRPNTPVRLTLRILNPRTTPLTLTQALVHVLPTSVAAMSIAAIPNLLVNNGVTAIATEGSNQLVIPNGTVLPPGLTQIQFDVVVPVAGTYCSVLPVGALQTDACASAQSSTACLVADGTFVMAPLLQKTFTPQLVPTGQNSLLTIVIENRNTSSLTLTKPLNDFLPAGLTVAGSATSSCGSVSINGGGTVVTLANGSVIAPGRCTITVPVAGTATGNFCNQIPMDALAGLVGTMQTGNEDVAEGCLRITANPIFDLALRTTLSPGQDTLRGIGDVVSYQIQVFNQGSVNATNVQITDYLPAGMTLVADANWTATGNTATRTLPMLPAGSDITLTIQLQITPSVSSSALINRAEVSVATGGTDVDSRPDSDPANDAGGLIRSASDNSVNGDGTGTPNSPMALRDEDDADPAMVAVRTCVSSNLSVQTLLTPTTIRSATQTVQVTFTVQNNSNAPLSNVAFNGLMRLFNNDTAPLESLSTVRTGDLDNDNILQPGEVWQYAATRPGAAYQPGDAFVVYGTATAVCGTSPLQNTGGNLLLTETADIEAVVSTSCVRPGQTIDVDLIARMLIDEDMAASPVSLTIGSSVVQLPKRRYEGRNLRLQSPLFNGGQPFDPFNPPVGIEIEPLVDQNGADGGHNQDNVLDESDPANTVRRGCTSPSDVRCDFPDWTFRLKLTLPANYTATTLAIPVTGTYDLYELMESPTGSNAYSAATSLGVSSGTDSATINLAPNAGLNQTLICANEATNTLTTSTTLQPSPSGGTWSQIGNTPTAATLNGNTVSGMTVAGTYLFEYTFNGCRDTVDVTVQPCVPVCTLSLTLTPGQCQLATNTFTLTGRAAAANAPESGVLTISSSVFAAPIVQGLPVGNSSGPLTVNDLNSNGQAFVVTASHSSSACPAVSRTVVAPVSCLVAPPCQTNLVVTPGACNPLTNTYSATAILTAEHIQPPRSATLTVAGQTQVVSLTGAGSNEIVFVVNNLPSNGATPMATALFDGTLCQSASTTFAAPASCSVALPCSASLTVSAGQCQSASNTYSATAILTASNVTVPQTVTITVAGNGQTPVSLSAGENIIRVVVNNMPANGQEQIAFATFSGTAVCPAVSTTFTAPTACTVACVPPNATLTSATICPGTSATLVASGGTLYQFSDGSLNSTARIVVSPLITTTYSVTVTNSNNCTAIANATVTVLPPVNAQISGSLSFCAGGSTLLTGSGGVGLPVGTYRWNTGATTSTLSVTTTGTYSLTVISVDGCQGTTSVTVTEQPNPVVTATSATVCAGQTATLTAGGANRYSWSNGGNTASIQVAPSATTVYSVTGFSASGCSAISSATATVNGQPQLTGISRSSVCTSGVASLTVNATNSGPGVLEYSLNGGAFQTINSFTINAPTSTTATVVVRTMGSTCQTTELVVINCACQTPASVTFVPTALQTCVGSPVSFTVNVSGAGSASLSSSGTGLFSQSVISGQTTVNYEPSVADAAAGSVTLTLRSDDPDGANDCQPAQLSRILVINPVPIITVSSVTVCTGSIGVLAASGGSTYRWNTGQTTANLSVSVSGSYAVTGITAQGCSATTSATVTVQRCNTATSISITGPGNTSTSTQPVVSGVATPGTVLIITDARGTTLCSTTVTAGGTFSCAVNVPLGPNSLTITASGPGGTTSVTTSFTSVPPPSVSLTVPPSSTNTSPTIAGTVTPGSVIVITGPNGATLCSTTATSSTFACPVTVPPGPQSLTVAVCNEGGCSTSVLIFTTTMPAGILSLQVRVLLQGGLAGVTNGTLMHDLLRAGGYLPLTTPYSASVSPRFSQTGGGGNETTTPAVLSANVGTANAIVDWVLIELRSETAPNVVVATRSGLLQRDGDVVSPTDGVSPLSFTGLSGSLFYVSVKHRNHLGVMTALPVPLSGFGTVVDFTAMTNAQVYDKPGSSVSFDGFEMITVNGKRALWAGDANADGKVKYVGSAADVSRILSEVISAQGGSPLPTYNFDFALGYYFGDVDLNGKVKYQGSGIDPAWVFSNVVVNFTLNTTRLYNYDFMIEQLP